MPETALILGTIASVGGQILSVRSQRRATKEAEKQQTLTTDRNRRQLVRQAQIARANAIAGAVGSGVGVSSGVSGGIGSLSSTLGNTLGIGSQLSGLSANINRLTQNAQLLQGFSSLGQGAMTYGLNQGASFAAIPDYLRNLNQPQLNIGPR